MTKVKGSILFAALLIGLGSLWGGCAFIGNSAMSEPNLKVVGIVTDKDTGQPVAGARVADNIYAGAPYRPCREAWTDKDGRFVLDTWYEEHTIVASAPGYPPQLNTLLTKSFKTEPQVEMNFSLRKK